ncbi:PQQ-binding-like beta-propeller repeat protein [Nocardioides sp. QY071]|uniref:outer membrane protein assembly factor BamB family protein n=1 Tax=Nocardioides sp. QY071 TaxID=3044187 RepID=UPI00249CE140|nr:PQQ-binding-like beta-propeller repeat protein [Nocardioides sp. QY071]WGY01376.1 PQQ-binding-like beta-propeller repeat protein [Nocardioides sp. QY071]
MLRAPRRTAASVAAVLLALTAAACDTADEPAGRSGGSAGPRPAELSVDWTRPVSALNARVTPTADGYVVAGSGVTALGKDGSVRWTQDVDAKCAASEPNAAGDVAVTHGRKCQTVSLVDGVTGELRWTVRIPLVSKRYDSGGMALGLGERALTLVQFCGQVTRLAVADGSRLGVIAPHDRKCANEADSDGRTLAVWHDPVDASTPDDHGTGWIPQTDGEGAFALYDVDSGKQLWHRAAGRRGGDLRPGAVVSSDPLVLALTERGHTTLRRFTRDDPTPGVAIGRQLDAYAGSAFTALGVAGDVLVGSTTSPGDVRSGARLYAFDLATGEQLWSRQVQEPGTNLLVRTVAGVDADGVVVATSDAQRRSGDDEGRTWLHRWDLRTGEDSGVMGVVPQPSSALALDGDAVLLGTADEIRRVTLPDADPEVTAPQAEPAWQDGDVRDVADCLAVSDRSLHLLALDASRDLPAPIDCHWSETAEPSYSSRDLWVDVTVARPTPAAGDQEARTATEAAEEVVRQLVAEAPGRTGNRVELELAPARPVDGLGDEAWAVSAADLSGSIGADTAGYLVVRVRNVVVVAQYAGGFDVGYRHAAPPPLGQVEDGLLLVAREALASYGLDLGADPARPADGDRAAAPDVCALLDRDARGAGLLEKTVITRSGVNPRVSSCAWTEAGDEADDLTAHAYAVDGSRFSGADATATAAAIHAASVYDARRVKGLGDRADLLASDATVAEDGYANSRRELWLRKGNLLVNIDYSRWGAGLGRSTEDTVLRLARKVLRAG